MIFKFQQGGQSGAQDIQQQVLALVQAALVQNDPQAKQQLQAIIEAANNGDQEAAKLMPIIQEAVNAVKSQARKQQIGGKLAYIHMLRTGVKPDEEIIYERCGGKVTKKVAKKACGGARMKENGGNMPKEEKKETVAKKAYFDSCGGKAKKSGAKKCYFGGSL